MLLEWDVAPPEIIEGTFDAMFVFKDVWIFFMVVVEMQLRLRTEACLERGIAWLEGLKSRRWREMNWGLS